MKKIHHRYVVRGGLMPDIHERKNVARVGLIGKKLLHSHAPLLFFGFGNFSVAVTGEINQMKSIIEQEYVDQACFAGGGTGSGQFRLSCETVDQTAFSDIALSGNGDLRQPAAFEVSIGGHGSDKAGFPDFRDLVSRDRFLFGILIGIFLFRHVVPSLRAYEEALPGEHLLRYRQRQHGTG